MTAGVALRRSPRQLWRAVGQEVLLTTPDADDFRLLSGPCAVVWALLDGPRERAEIMEIVASVYERDVAAVDEELSPALDDMIRLGLLEQALRPDPASL